MPKRTKYNAYDITVMRRTMTTQQICDHYGVSYSALTSWCHRNGVKMVNLEEREEMAGRTVKEIAQELGITKSAVYMYYHKYKIEMTINKRRITCQH